jgi:sulfite exporter TauE/SafE
MDSWHHALHHFALSALQSPWDLINLVQILSYGFLTSWHCVGMCCPLLFAVNANGNWFPFVIYQFARWVSYCLVAVALSLALQSTQYIHDQLSVLLAAALGAALVVAGVWRLCGWAMPRPFSRVWHKLSTIPLPFLNPTVQSNKAFLLGLGTGLLPCMTLSPAYIAAASANSPLLAVIAITGFFVGTLPSFVLARSIPALSSKLRKLSESRLLTGILWIFAGLVTILRVWHNAH